MLPVGGALIDFAEKILGSFYRPMCRNFADPFDTRIPHGYMRIKATGYGLLDQYLLALFKSFDLTFFDLYCCINLNRLLIKEMGDIRLLLFSRKSEIRIG